MHSDELRNFFNRFLPVGEEVQSLPLKGSTFSLKPMKAHPVARTATPRSVAALAAAAAASRCKLAIGELVPRRLSEPLGVVENGAASDILRAGLAIAAVMPTGAEAFQLTKSGIDAIKSTVPESTLNEFFG